MEVYVREVASWKESPNCHLEPDRELSKPNQIHLIMNSRKKAQIVPIWSLITSKICPKMSKKVQKRPKTSRNVQIDMSKNVQKRPKASKNVQICPKTSKSVQNFQKCPKASKSIQKCSKMAKHVKKVKIYQNISKHDEIKQKKGKCLNIHPLNNIVTLRTFRLHSRSKKTYQL